MEAEVAPSSLTLRGSEIGTPKSKLPFGIREWPHYTPA